MNNRISNISIKLIVLKAYFLCVSQSRILNIIGLRPNGNVSFIDEMYRSLFINIIPFQAHPEGGGG